MKKKKILFYSILLITIYFIGLATGVYKFFPYYYIENFKNKIKVSLTTEPRVPVIETKKKIEKNSNKKENILKTFKLPEKIQLVNSTPLNHFNLNWVRVENENIGKLSYFDFEKDRIYYLNQDDEAVLKKINLSIKDIEDKAGGWVRGGIKSYFKIKDLELVYVAYEKNFCAKSSIFDINTGREIISFPCVPDYENHDLNGTGGAFLKIDENRFILSVGTPTASSKKIDNLAQDPKSPYGKFLLFEINSKNDLSFRVFSSGHRNPQGVISIYNNIIAVEHGPMGGDEINIIKEENNYGWPFFSVGSHYDLRKISKDKKNSVLPLYGFNPSIAINQIQNCPKSYEEYYSPLKCISVSSFKGGIFFLLTDEKLEKVINVEQLNFETRIRKFKIFGDNLYIGTDYDGLIFGAIEIIKKNKPLVNYKIK